MVVTKGFDEHERELVAQMYWQAFGSKLGRVMGPDDRAIAFLCEMLDPTHAICARDEKGMLLGVVGFKTFESALVGGTWNDMLRHYGWFGAIWRAVLLSLLERDVENERFLMDGIFVRDIARGQGVGTMLLDAVTAEARDRGYKEVRLDVIDSNPRARALYERLGFIALPAQKLGLLRHVFGFKTATPMIRQV